jgi:predicted transposase/invertase (TIGR01784 family)
MILTEYDYDTDIAVQREEAYEEGAKQKAVETAKKMLENGISKEIIANCTGLSHEEVEKLAKELKS